jgi:hypothetical protein
MMRRIEEINQINYMMKKRVEKKSDERVHEGK